MFYPRSDADRLYLDRSLGWRGVKSIFNSVRREERQLGEYMMNSSEIVMKDVEKRLNVKVKADEIYDRCEK